MTKVVRFLAAADDAPLAVDGVVRHERTVALDLPGLPPPRWAAVEIVWLDGPVSAVALGPADVVVDAEVRRGADRLVDPSTAGRYRMMSVARRNPALRRADFADRWRAEAGRLGGEAIPEDVRGLAYVQDHPVGDDPPFDAINEVWFDTLDGLRRRAEWFAARAVPTDLFDPEASFALYLRAEPPRE